MSVSFDKIKRLLKSLPETSGVYKMKNEEGLVIYIGKAKNLRNRVAQHFQAGRGVSAKNKKMIEKIADIDVIETTSEFEALILETNLIKELRPRYNVLMRDDKNYVYIKVSTNEDYPRLSIVRKREKDGAVYFGPKTSSDACEKLINLLRKIFPIRTCGLEMHDGKDDHIVITKKTCPVPCLDYHIKRCRAPCINLIKKEEYQELIKQIVRFLRGAYQDLITRLKYQMLNSAREKKFETAAKIRDQIKAIETMFQKQRVSDPEFIDRDVIGVFPDFDKTFINLFQFREGKLISQENFTLDTPETGSTEAGAEQDSSVMESFLRSYYSECSDIPTEIFVREQPENHELWETWLAEQRGYGISGYSCHSDRSGVEIGGKRSGGIPFLLAEKRRDSSIRPSSPGASKDSVGMTEERNSVRFVTSLAGKKHKILELAEKNAASFARQSRAKWMADAAKTTQACEDLAQELGVEKALSRIECYDISHLGGEDTTASMVVFLKGSPQPKLYRHFKLKTLESGEVDDYKALEEVLARRLQRLTGFSSATTNNQYHFKKPLKKDAEILSKLFNKNHQNPHEPYSPNSLNNPSSVGVYWKQQLVGYCRLHQFNEGSSVCMSDIFLEGEHDTRALQHQLFQHIARKVTVPHMYAVADKDRKEDFLSFGFTELKKVPDFLLHAVTPTEVEESRNSTNARSLDFVPSERDFARDEKNEVFLIYKISKTTNPDISFNAPPDLIMVDGGKGQLSSALKSLRASGLDIPVIGLAKQEEEIFISDPDHPGSFKNVYLPRNSQALYLVQRIRDESHRFANELRKKLGTKKLTESDIDSLPGIGQILKRRLLKEYGSINGIKAAPMEQLEKTVGTYIAKMLKDKLC